jgi:hypothetical protein
MAKRSFNTFNKQAQAGVLHVHVVAVPGSDDEWEWFALQAGKYRIPGGVVKTRNAAMQAAEQAFNRGSPLGWTDIKPAKPE